MAILKVAQLGHPILRQIAEPVPADQVGHAEIQRLVDDLLDTVDAYDGAGLAAPQVHVSLRVVVLNLDDDAGMRVWINPVLIPLTEDQIVSYEGCLSVPRLRAAVPRAARIEVQALDRDGQAVQLELEGFPAIVAQHECDHLDGVIYVDRCDTSTLTFLDEYRRFGPWPLAESGEDEDEAHDESDIHEGEDDDLDTADEAEVGK